MILDLHANAEEVGQKGQAVNSSEEQTRCMVLANLFCFAINVNNSYTLLCIWTRQWLMVNQDDIFSYKLAYETLHVGLRIWKPILGNNKVLH